MYLILVYNINFLTITDSFIYMDDYSYNINEIPYNLRLLSFKLPIFFLRGFSFTSFKLPHTASHSIVIR